MNGHAIWWLRILPCFMKIIQNGPNHYITLRNEVIFMWILYCINNNILGGKKLSGSIPSFYKLENQGLERGTDLLNWLLTDKLRHIKNLKSLFEHKLIEIGQLPIQLIGKRQL